MEDSKIPHEDEEVEKQIKSKKGLSGKWEEYEKFYEFHGMQLYGMNFPCDLGEKLYYKLKYEVFDSSRFFEIQENQNEGRLLLKSKINIKKDFEVFLVDHCWTFKIRQFNEFCEKYPSVIQRVLDMVKYSNNKKDILTVEEYKEKEKFSSLENAIELQMNHDYELLTYKAKDNERFTYKYFEFDNFFIENPLISIYPHLDNLFKNSKLDEKIYYGLSLENNQMKNLNIFKEFLNKLISQNLSKAYELKALWIESNPFEVTDEAYEEELIMEFDNIELLNRKLNKNSSSWAFEYVYSNYSLESKFNNRYKNKLDNAIYNSIHANKRFFMDFNGRNPLAIEKLNDLVDYIQKGT